MTKKAIQTKLLGLLERGWDVSSACFNVGISRQSFYNRIEEDEGFAQAVDYSKTKIDRLSKGLIYDAIQAGDLSIAKWFIDKKAKTDSGVLGSEDDVLANVLDEIMDEDTKFI